MADPTITPEELWRGEHQPVVGREAVRDHWMASRVFGEAAKPNEPVSETSSRITAPARFLLAAVLAGLTVAESRNLLTRAKTALDSSIDGRPAEAPADTGALIARVVVNRALEIIDSD